MLFSAPPSADWAVLTDPEFNQAALMSLLGAICSTAVAFCFGIPTAYMMSRITTRWKRVIEGLLLLPLILPPLVGGIAELNTIGPLTPLGEWFGNQGIPLTNSFIGIVLAQSFVTSPFLILSAKAGFDDVPKEFRDVAVLMGASLIAQLRYLYFPLSTSSIVTGLLLTFTRAFGEFGATMLVSYHPYSLPVYMWVQFTSVGLTGLVPIAAIIVVTCVIILSLISIVQKQKG